MSSSTPSSSRLPSSATLGSGPRASAGKYVPPGRRSQQSTPSLPSVPTSASSSRSPISHPSQRSLPPQSSRQTDWGSTSSTSTATSSREPWTRTNHTDWSLAQSDQHASQSHSASPYPRSNPNHYGRGDPASSGSKPYPSRSAYNPYNSAPTGYRSYKPESAHLFLAGDSFVGALNPAKGPPPEEDVPETDGGTEEERIEYGRIKRLWAEYDAIPKMIKIKKEKGSAAKVGTLTLDARR